MLLAQAIAAQSGKLRDWKTSWVQKHEKHGRRCFIYFYMFFCFLFAFFCLFFFAWVRGWDINSVQDWRRWVSWLITCSNAHLQGFKSRKTRQDQLIQNIHVLRVQLREGRIWEKKDKEQKWGKNSVIQGLLSFKNFAANILASHGHVFKQNFQKSYEFLFFKDGILGILLGANFCLLGFRLTQPLPVQPSPPQAQIQCLNCIFPCQAFLRRILVPIPWNITSFLVEMLVT